MDNPLAKRRHATYGGTAAQDDLPSAYGCSRGTFSKAGFNLVESAAMLREFVAAPHERWAELAKRMRATEHAEDHTAASST
jgi:hypothetical protein